MKILPGRPYPLGATWDGSGVNFAIFSQHAAKVELCLFDSVDSHTESRRIVLPERTELVWHVYLQGIQPGQLYGYRIYGPYQPQWGHRFNPHKLLVDPYARLIPRLVKWHDVMFGYKIGDPQKDLSFDKRDSAAYAPLASVVDPRFDWKGDQYPRTPWHKTLIYELHVKGMTKLLPSIPEKIRGTYAGLASEPVLRHLKSLGVTAVELMPVHQGLDDRHLVDRKLRNYWAYNTLGYFAPDIRYVSGKNPLNTVNEFKEMVRTFHSAGMEVILDVVYNHTAEGNQMGPMLCFRGIDNAIYYRIVPGNARYYEDFTGCGNTLNMMHPPVLQMMMDSLRYWVQEMHVDGFRFDLASALARREPYSVDKLSAFFEALHQDPVLSQVKLIAEPWDLSHGGYQVGNFPVGWAEWNARYRDTMRRFWKGDGGMIAEFATRLSGSSDLYESSGRRPHSSINFLTCHDGFTMQDLVSYNDKHNRANGENNLDGENHNNSWNCGAEGPTKDTHVLELRDRQKRNMMATLFFSLGVPMIRGGDELSQTQRGNNNAYCQDNEISWVHWDLNETKKEFLEFTKYMTQLWREQPVLRRRKFFKGASMLGSDMKDIMWFDPMGREMSPEMWHAQEPKGLGVLMAGNMIDEIDEKGEPLVGDTLFMILNSSHKSVNFAFPRSLKEKSWERIFDTYDGSLKTVRAFRGDHYRIHERSMAVFRLKRKVFIIPMQHD